MSKIMLIDGNSIANRAFYALPLLSNSKGVFTNAVYGFMNIFFKFFDLEKPDFIKVAFDLKAPTFRHKVYTEYKGQRKGMPEELKMQMPIIKEVLGLMNIPIMQMEGYEADDLIGTMAKKYEADGYDVTIVSGDRDLLQVASDKICIKMPKTKGGKTEVESYFESDVIEKMGVTPKEYIDVKALMGDSSDNIPGVPGIGEKTAFKLIGEYKSLDNLYEHIDEVPGAKAKEKLAENKQVAYDSKFLVTIKLDVPMETETEKYGPIYNEKLHERLLELETKTLLERLKREFGTDNLNLTGLSNNTNNVSNDSKEIKENNAEIKEDKIIKDAKDSNKVTEKEETSEENNESLFEAYEHTKASYEIKYNKINKILSEEEFEKLKNKVLKEKEILLKIFTNGNELIAIAVALKSKEDKTEGQIYFAEKATMLNEVSGITEEMLFEFVSEIFENEEIKKVCYDVKKDIRYILSNNEKSQIKNYYDLMVAYYVRTLSNGPYTMYDFASNYLGVLITNEKETFTFVDANGKAKSKEILTIAELSDEKREKYLTEFFNVLANGYDSINSDLDKNEDKKKLFSDLENPLIYVLAKMESAGIKVDIAQLKRYSEDINNKVIEVTKRIYELAGCEFNISSPKQLGEVLFEKLGIVSKKKTKTGLSTSAETLEKLIDVHPIIKDVLSYRQLEKLRSTYADGLFEYIETDQKIHTTFNQVITSTGRLSSTDPNLQNIPIRMELGRKIRKAFVPASDDYIFVDADYSQIELRVMAHMSGDEKLIEGYKSGEDIHRLTASQVFNVPLAEVTDQMRSAAKAVNFGIIYGISSFGLSEDIHITRKKADEYIQNYFEKYSRVKQYLDELVKDAEENGYSSTMYGRQRKIDELKSSNYMKREFGKRIAMNSPVQGTAADIMKIAMVKFNDRIEKEKIDARILLQVHDELVVETKKENKDLVSKILKEEMESAAELKVPLIAEVKSGSTWYETK